MTIMTGNQRGLLDRRFRAALELQPEISDLRSLLLQMGGKELVAPNGLDPDLDAVIRTGREMKDSVEYEAMDGSSCHTNVARLWLVTNGGLVGIGTGYALSDDGLWRQHSWGVRRRGLVETTRPRVRYFGIMLTGKDADLFATANH
jgi:hypothetical protein